MYDAKGLLFLLAPAESFVPAPQVRSHLSRSQMRQPAQRSRRHRSLGRAQAGTPGARSTSASCAAWGCLPASHPAARADQAAMADQAARWSSRGCQRLLLKLLSMRVMEARWRPRGGELSLMEEGRNAPCASLRLKALPNIGPLYMYGLELLAIPQSLMHACRLPEAAPEVAHASHTNLPRRGEQWQQSADVTAFLQKGHVHFADSVRFQRRFQ